MDGWHDFFLAAAGASAVLLGLIFVGVSINLTDILAAPSLPSRALESLLILLAALIVSSLMLVPEQSPQSVGIETLAIGAVVWTGILLLDTRIVRRSDHRARRRYAVMILLNQIAILPYVCGGILILSGNVNGLYWFVPAILVSMTRALMDAWVLLVEIKR